MFNYNNVSFEDSKKKLHTYKLLEIINSIYRQRQMAIFNQDWNLVDKLNFHGQILAEMMLQEDYRKSLHWQERRNSQLTRTSECEFCSRPAEVVHHNKYFGVLFMERLGIDLKSLCHNCHQTQHECINVISGKEIIQSESLKKVN